MKKITDIEFISGPRKDGVVITGQEKITKVNVRKILAERAYNDAVIVFKSGSFFSAARILEDFKDFYLQEYKFAMMMYYRSRFNYTKAIESAPSASQYSNLLNQLRKASIISVIRLADMFCYADHCLKINEPEESLAILYRATEYAVKLKLQNFYIPAEKEVDKIAILENPELKISNVLKNKINTLADAQGKLRITLSLGMELLSNTETRLYYEIFHKSKYREPLPPEHPAMLRFKGRRCATLSAVRSWIHEEHRISRKTPANSIASNFTAQGPCMSVSVRARQCKSVSSPSPQSSEPRIAGVFTHSYLAANAALSLPNLTTFLLRKQLDSPGRDFLEEGGFSERIYKQRKQYTNQQKRRNSV